MRRLASFALVLSIALTAWGQDKPSTPPEKKDAPAAKKDAGQESKETPAGKDAKAGAKDEKAAKPEGGKDDAKAREILKKADEATKKTTAVKYNFIFRATGGVEKFFPKVKGSAVLSGKVKKADDFFANARFEFKATAPDGTDEMEGTITTNGEKFALMLPKAKKVHEDVDSTVLGRYGWPRGVAGQIGMREYSHPEPFSDELKADKVELRGEKEIGGEKCYQIYVAYAADPMGRPQGEAMWFFSAKDYLPRRAERMISAEQTGGEPGALELELHDLVVGPTFVADPFTMVVPEGYTKTSDPAP